MNNKQGNAETGRSTPHNQQLHIRSALSGSRLLEPLKMLTASAQEYPKMLQGRSGWYNADAGLCDNLHEFVLTGFPLPAQRRIEKAVPRLTE